LTEFSKAVILSVSGVSSARSIQGMLFLPPRKRSV
jgi:hypothetical protein